MEISLMPKFTEFIIDISQISMYSDVFLKMSKEYFVI